jgi:hypothetical protein
MIQEFNLPSHYPSLLSLSPSSLSSSSLSSTTETTSSADHSLEKYRRTYQSRIVTAAIEEQKNLEIAYESHDSSSKATSTSKATSEALAISFSSDYEEFINTWEQRRNERLNREQTLFMKKQKQTKKRKLDQERKRRESALSLMETRRNTKFRDISNATLNTTNTSNVISNNATLLEQVPSVTIIEDDNNSLDLNIVSSSSSSASFDDYEVEWSELDIILSKTFDEDEEEWVDDGLEIATSEAFDEADYAEIQVDDDSDDDVSIEEKGLPSPMNNENCGHDGEERCSHALQNSRFNNRFVSITSQQY